MTSGSADPSNADRRLPASDPDALARAARWRDLTLEGQRLALEVNGTVGPASWSEIQARSAGAFVACALTPSEEDPPRFEGDSRWTNPAELGYAYLVGEAGLRVDSSGLFGPTYSSFVAKVHLWVRPALAKGAPDRPDVPHTWAVRVGAGQVKSTDINAKWGPYRHLRSVAPLDPGFEWVPREILRRLQQSTV